ncbi:alpha-ketoglutarate-dependent dioxygenase alkB homolog 4 [Lepeophtheirus salmonis]|uniref:Uncharacterized protein n=1 Tax=Lepeophtheirus salmonis TaxID=72036 RepID=A0A0K2UX98_LEPSM|nr:alpha-ketoglutarate-dependent dioxygenase alkB homolog 4-like [Lepeophtheirus salmonis]
MNTNRPCGCKSFKTCFACEKDISNDTTKKYESLTQSLRSSSTGVYCPDCRSIYPGWEISPSCQLHPSPIVNSFSGIQIIPNFINSKEQHDVLKGLDQLPWDPSVSGRRKQNFGPRANFNKRKAKNGPFHGFPLCTQFIQKRFNEIESLQGYQVVEQCSIEYRKGTGAWIEPHVDDCWIWGERIVQLHVLSNSVLTLNKCQKSNKYNLNDVFNYPRILSNNGDSVLYNPFRDDISSAENMPYSPCELMTEFDTLRIPLPELSLLIFYGEPRYQWEHSVLREDVLDERRVIIAYREFTPPFLPGGESYETVGKKVIESAKKFW